MRRARVNRLAMVVWILFAGMLTNGCTGAPTSPGADGDSESGDGSGSGRHGYCALAVSDGFDRNDAWAIACGNNLQGTINTAHTGCEQKANTFCSDLQQCVAISAPYVAFARVSVFDPSFLLRGSYGFVCNQSSLAAAQANAVALCGYPQCQLLYSGAP